MRKEFIEHSIEECELLTANVLHALDSSSKITTIGKKFFSLHKISFFSFYRIYDDGSAILLSSKDTSLKYIFENNIHVSPIIDDKNIIKNKFWYTIPQNSIYQKLLFDFREMFGSEIIFDFIERFNGFYEVSYFGSYCKPEIAITDFMNHKNEFEKFVYYFKQHYFSTIPYNEIKKTIIPPDMQTDLRGITSSSSYSPRPLSFYPHGLKLTAREAECVYHLSLGHTAKKTAEHLGLAVRTIEHYLANIKDKLKCNKKSEIISILHKSYNL